ncbi:MAG TPA: hypothetical protein VFU12_08590 [Glycomyces sp.]|nr:hypothetical protein [Glycomyces sp.]
MLKASKPLGTLGLAAALATTAGCGVFGGDEEPASAESRLVEMINESARLENELTSAENRIVRGCLEAQGHTVHDEYELGDWGAAEAADITWGYSPHTGFLLDRDEAAEYGFGMWAESPEAVESGDADEYWAAQEEQWEEGDWGEEPDNSAFEALEPEAQYDWYVAYYGQEYADEYYGWALDPEGASSFPGGDGTDEETESSGEGELEIGGDAYTEPKPGGCKLEMIEGLYGGVEAVEHDEEFDGGTETWTEWVYRPQSPESASGHMWEDIELAYTDSMIDLQYEFTDCLAGAGHEGWEFDEYGSLPVWDYFAPLYWEDGDAGPRGFAMGTEAEAPELPADVPADYEGRKAYEIQVALDFIECGEELDYAATSADAYEEAHVDAYAAIEEDTYAWQEEMREAISRAQDLIDS